MRLQLKLILLEIHGSSSAKQICPFRCHHLKGIMLLLGFSSSNSAQIFDCSKAADKNYFNSGIQHGGTLVQRKAI